MFILKNYAINSTTILNCVNNELLLIIINIKHILSSVKVITHYNMTILYMILDVRIF